MIVYLNKHNYVGNLFITDATEPLEISNEQGDSICSFGYYEAGRYYPETGEFKLEPIMTLEMLRGRRDLECFKIIDNRSILGWNSLSEARKEELNVGYSAGLNVTETLVIPEKPEGLN